MDKERIDVQLPRVPNGYLEEWYQPKTRPVVADEPFVPTSMMLLTQDSTLLNESNDYTLRFNTGMADGPGISIDATGSKISFSRSGSYRFELVGTATPFSDIGATVLFDSPSFSEDIKDFAQFPIICSDNRYQLTGLATMLSIRSGEVVRLQIIPEKPETILVLSGLRLLIHRLA